MIFFNIFAIFVAVCSVMTFVLYGLDKIFAINGMWRIPEKILLISSILGGGIGGGLAMLLFRHKTKHWYFIVINVIGVIWQAALLIFLAFQ